MNYSSRTDGDTMCTGNDSGISNRDGGRKSNRRLGKGGRWARTRGHVAMSMVRGRFALLKEDDLMLKRASELALPKS